MFSLINVSEITQTFGLFLTGGYGPFLSFCSWINRTCWLKKSWQGNQKLKITFLNTRITLYLRMVSFFTTSGLWLTGIAQFTAPLCLCHTRTQTHNHTALSHEMLLQECARQSSLLCPVLFRLLGLWSSECYTCFIPGRLFAKYFKSVSSKRSKTCTLWPL